MDADRIEQLWEEVVGGYLDHPALGGHLERWCNLLVEATGCDRDLVFGVVEAQGLDLIVDHRPSGEEVSDVLDELLGRLYDVKPFLVCEYVVSADAVPAETVVATAREIASRCDEMTEVIELAMSDDSWVGAQTDPPPASPTGEQLLQESAPSLFGWRRFGG